jgi:hypothetical protein
MDVVLVFLVFLLLLGEQLLQGLMDLIVMILVWAFTGKTREPTQRRGLRLTWWLTLPLAWLISIGGTHLG